MSKFTRLTVVLGLLAVGIAAIGASASLVQAGPPTPSGSDDTGLSMPALGL
jgi:hypothetical protein